MLNLSDALRFDRDESLPWERARVTTMPELLDRHSLHDAEWLRLDVAPGLGAPLVFEWPGRRVRHLLEPKRGPVAEWPLLIVGIDDAYQAVLPSSDPCVRTVGIASSCHVPTEERERLVDSESAHEQLLTAAVDASLHRTTIQSIAGGAAVLLHGATVHVLCLGPDGSVLELPWDAPETS